MKLSLRTPRMTLGVLAFLLTIIAAGTVRAQQSSQPFELKDPETAKTYALYFSGLGHFYTGEHARAAVMLGTTVVAGYKLIDELGCQVASNSFLGADMGCSQTKKFVWLGLAVAPYVYGIIDSKKSAGRVNARLRQKASRPTGLLDLGPDGQVMVGMQLTLR